MIDQFRYINPFANLYFEDQEEGYVAWRIGTGWNLEILHLRANTPRMGIGTELFLKVLRWATDKYGQLDLYSIEEEHKLQTVYGFTRVSNLAAQSFYLSMGFDLQKVRGVYSEGEAILFSAKTENLLQKWADHL